MIPVDFDTNWPAQVIAFLRDWRGDGATLYRAPDKVHDGLYLDWEPLPAPTAGEVQVTVTRNRGLPDERSPAMAMRLVNKYRLLHRTT
jgi:hypothetical protein